MSKTEKLVMRPINKKRISKAYEFEQQDLTSDDRWFLHSILTQCFMPYRDPLKDRWIKKNGHYGVAIMSGVLPDEDAEEGVVSAGIPYGAKPRLINSYVQTYAVKHRTPVIPVAGSMSGFMKSLGFKVTGGKKGTIRGFQEQCTKLATSKWSIWGPKAEGEGVTLENTEPFKRIDLWYPNNPEQKTLWPSEIELTNDFFASLVDHAIPYDYRALSLLRANARAQDIYLWLTQRLYRIPRHTPLKLSYETLFEMFGGGITEQRKFRDKFDESIKIALVAYKDARLEKLPDNEGFLFKCSSPPIPKVSVLVIK